MAVNVKMQESAQSVESLAGYLCAVGFPVYGNLSTLREEDRQQTMECIESLLRARQKDSAAREEASNSIFMLEQERRRLMRELDLANDRIDVLKGDVGRAELALRTNANKWKAEKDKLTTEREELKKELAKTTGSKDQLIHDLKKRDGLITKLQDQARKASGDCSALKSLCEIPAPLPPGSAGCSDFAAIYRRNYEDTVAKLVEENENYRQGAVRLMEGLQERVKKMQTRSDIREEIRSFRAPVGKVAGEGVPKATAEAVLSLLDLWIGQESEDTQEERENEEEGVWTMKDARNKLKTYKERFVQQESILSAIRSEREVLSALDSSACSEEFRSLAASLLGEKRTENAFWRAFASSFSP